MSKPPPRYTNGTPDHFPSPISRSTNTYLPGAREKSAGHLFGDKRGSLNLVASESEQFFGQQVLNNQTSGGMNQLEFPINLGTEEHSHIVVFHIYTDLEAGMGDIDQETLQKASMGRLKKNQWGYAGGALGSVGGLAAGRAWGSKSAKGRILSQAAGAAAGWFAGQWSAEQLAEIFGEVTEEEQEAIQKISEYEAEQDARYRQQADDYFEATGRTARIGQAIHRSKDTIALYMPQKVQSLSLLEYEQQDLSFMQNVMNSWTGLAAAGLLKKAPGVVDSLAGFLGMNTNIDTYIQATARIAPNPRKQLLFREPVSRKFEFVFNFSPRNEEESVRVYEIIQTFKKHAYPALNNTIGQGAFYTFPAEFEIQYQMLLPGTYGDEIVENNWINRIGRCGLREINVDYASSGSFSTFPNGAPTNMTMSLTFEELSLLDQNHIEQGY